MNIFYNYNSEKGRHSLNPMLFWEYDLKTLDLQKSRNLVVKRVVELGKSTDFYACFDLYGGIENVAKIAQDEKKANTDEKKNGPRLLRIT